MGMFSFKSKYNDLVSTKPIDIKSQEHNMHYKRQSKVVSQPVHLPTPPMSPKAYARASITPASSVESTPKTSMDYESPAITCSRVNFASETLPEYQDAYAVLIDGALSQSECKQLIQDAEASGNGWERAMINTGNGQQAMYTDQRNCGRIIYDSQETIDKIWDRVSDLPEIQEIMSLQNKPSVTGNGPARRNETWQFERPNERMRFLKYEDGEYFRPHCDGSYETPDRKQRSYYTMHLYLNDAGPPTASQLRNMSSEERKYAKKHYLMGGSTAFHSYDGQRQFNVVPKAGSILIFQHRDLLHSGTDVLQGTKYTMRTDLMYSKV